MPPNTPRPRLRRTRRIVVVEDRIARGVVTVGGVSVVVAVLGVCLYLAATVLPLFQRGRAAPGPTPVSTPAARPLALVIDQDTLAATILDDAATLHTALLESGRSVEAAPLVSEGGPPVAITSPDPSGMLLLALPGGSFQFATIAFDSALLASAPSDSEALTPGVVGASGTSSPPVLDPTRSTGGFLQRTDAGQTRLTVPARAVAPPLVLPGAPDRPVRIAFSRARSGERAIVSLAPATGQGAAGIFARSRTITPLGGTPTEEWMTVPIPSLSAGPPDWLFITADGASILCVYRTGDALRLAPGPTSVVIAEQHRLVPPGVSITSATMLLGGLTLVLGDDRGSVHGWFTAPDPQAGTPDSLRLVEAHNFRVSDAAITALSPASRDRLIVAADEAGNASLVHMTSHKVVASFASRLRDIAAVAPSPRADAIVLASPDARLDTWRIDLGHPKVSFHALFGRPLYEGQLTGSYTYQSSAGSDEAELKMSLVPLLFGTLKATVFATLFAVPLAVLAAIYTSEFLSPRSRRLVKPAIELMASLPSVVLGFVASMVVAPILAERLPQFLTCLITLPVAVLLGAHLWQLVPASLSARARSSRQVALVAACAALGIGAGLALTPAFNALFVPSRADTLVRAGSFEPAPAERIPAWIGDRRTLESSEIRRLREDGLAFRAGRVVAPVEPAPERAAEVAATIERYALDKPDLRAWLDGTIGAAPPGWIATLFPLALIASWITLHWLTSPLIRSQATQGRIAVASLLRFVSILLAAVVLALGLGHALTALGYDPRDSILGPFSVRNSLVVGIIMGFAIIPIIYTIADDAMRGVPSSLRLASLGAGATPWQTSIRVVLPVAASGIFSACMIGLGRAVGETMIVLMATGNSAEMSWNIFSGFRTLAANIAVELPESDVGSTHYRILFLCGLLLFALTFVINTTAEIVRQYFRRKNANL